MTIRYMFCDSTNRMWFMSFVCTYIATAVYNAFRVTAQLERIVLSLWKSLTRMFTIYILTTRIVLYYTILNQWSQFITAGGTYAFVHSLIVHSLIYKETAHSSRSRVVVFCNNILSSPTAVSLYPPPQLSIRIMLFWTRPHAANLSFYRSPCPQCSCSTGVHSLSKQCFVSHCSV